MFKNYLKIAIRNLVKHKSYTIINVLGLAIGMCACMLILMYVQDELRYDNFHEKGDRIIRITDDWTADGITENLAVVPFPVARTLQAEHPEIVENTVRLYRPASWGNLVVVQHDDKSFVEKEVMFADASLFDIFSFQITAGGKNTLASPNGVVITESAAKKYFGDENPLGKPLRMNSRIDLEIGAVIKDVPQNSHMTFDFLISQQVIGDWFGDGGSSNDNWIWTACWTYLLLNDGKHAETIQAALPDFVDRHFPASIKDGTLLKVQRLRDIHLHSSGYYEMKTNGSIRNVYIFSAIALLILLIACINFMNLATARSTSRAREVGMRKVLGAYRSNLIRQFLGETILLSFIALLVSIALIEIALPIFNDLTGKSLQGRYLENGVMIGGFIVIGLLVGAIAGSYPAFYLSGFRPIMVLKGALNGAGASRKSEASLRKTLVISQFFVSMVLLICISIVSDQLNFLNNKELGFNKEQVVFFDRFGVGQKGYQTLKNELLQHKDIIAMSGLRGSVPGEAGGIAHSFLTEGMDIKEPKWVAVIYANHDFEKVLGLEIVAGRPFSMDFATDSSNAFIINESAVKEFGWGDDAIGKKLERVNARGEVTQSGTVIGVVKDFHYQSLHESLKPLIIGFGAWQFAVRLQPENLSATMAFLQESWSKLVPGWPLNYRFLDENMDALYRSEQKLGEIIRYFTLLAVLIACMGLFGLVSFTTEKRTKEIGVRKVLGASIVSIILLITKEFTKLVMIAFLLAGPVAYFMMEYWLGNFAYQTTIGFGIFLYAGAIAMLIAFVTVSYQAIRAALANPVDALKYE